MTPTLSLQLESRLDSLREQFAHDRRINISSVWSADTASKLLETLKQTEFDNALFYAGRPTRLLDADIRAMPPTEQKAMQQNVMQNASQGIGFWYGSHYIDIQTRMQTAPLLKQFHQFMNQPSTLSLLSKLTGEPNIIYASAQATRYIPGNFLTRHNDVVEAEGRRIAYVFGFTPQWHPDWGGILHFFHQDGELKDSWVPSFNNLALFDVHHPHSVSFIAPFARAPRFAITGWLRTKATAS